MINVTKTSSLIALCGALLATGQPADAADLHVEASSALFRFLAEKLPARLSGPQTFGSESNGNAELKNLTTNLQFRSMVIEPNAGKIQVRFAVTGRADGELEVDYLIGSSDCDVSIDITDPMNVALDIAPTITAGRLKLNVASLSIDMDEDNTELDIGGCGIIDEIANAVLYFFEGSFVKKARKAVEDGVRNHLVPDIERELAGLTNVGGTVEGVSVAGAVTEITVDSHGLAAAAQATFTPVRQAPCAMASPGPSTPTVTIPASFTFRSQHVGIAISRDAMQDAVVAAWRSGIFCFDDSQMDMQGMSVDVSVPEVPQVTLTPGTEAQLRIALPRLSATINGDLPIAATMSLDIDLKLKIDSKRAVVFSEPTVTIGEIEVDSEDLPFDLRDTFRKLLVPVIEDQIEQRVVFPRVTQADQGMLGAYYLRLLRSDTSASYIHLYADLFAPPAVDARPPTAGFSRAPQGPVKPQIYVFTATGTDDKTPRDLLRYRFRVNGGAWTKTSYSARYVLDLTEGTHTVEVLAVDLNNNVSKKAASVAVTVDPNAVEQQPDAVTPDDIADILDGLDDQQSDATDEPETVQISGSGCTVGGHHPSWPAALILLALLPGFRRRRRSCRVEGGSQRRTALLGCLAIVAAVTLLVACGGTTPSGADDDSGTDGRLTNTDPIQTAPWYETCSEGNGCLDLVADSVTLPTTLQLSQALASDLDGDGKADNGLGKFFQVLKTLAPDLYDDFDVQLALDQSLNQGLGLVVVRLTPDARQGDASLRARLWLSRPTTCCSNTATSADCAVEAAQTCFGGTHTFDVDPPTGADLTGEVKSGAIHLEAKEVPFPITLFDGVTRKVTLRHVRIDGTLSGDRIVDAKLIGVLDSTDIEQTVLTAVSDIATDAIKDPKLDPMVAALARTLFDPNGDGTVSVAEVKDSFLGPLFEGDVVLDTLADKALSLGMGITATTARIRLLGSSS